jgi:hypothetical protein
MRKVGDLIEEVRLTANKPDQDRFSDEVLIRFFNSAQRYIQKEIFLANPENNYFDKQFEIQLNDAQEVYRISDYVSDAWARNSISGVLRVRSDAGVSTRGVKPLRKLTWKERNQGYGYYVFDGFIGVIPIPKASADSTLLVAYQARIPNLVDCESISELPTFCEEYLMLFVERKIQYADSSTDRGAAIFFTQEEREQMREVFAELNRDTSYPPMTDDSYVNY